MTRRESAPARGRRLAVCAGLSLALALAGCGGSDAKRSFDAKANAICRDIDARIVKAPPVQTLALLRSEIARVGALSPPSELRQTFSTYLANETAYVNRAGAALARKDLRAVNALNPHQDDALIRRLGITDCG